MFGKKKITPPSRVLFKCRFCDERFERMLNMKGKSFSVVYGVMHDCGYGMTGVADVIAYESFNTQL